MLLRIIQGPKQPEFWGRGYIAADQLFAPAHKLGPQSLRGGVVFPRFDELVQRGYLQVFSPKLTHLPAELFAPTERGVAVCAESLSMSVAKFTRHVRLTEPRFWAVRASVEISQEINAMCAATARNARPYC